MTCVLAGTTHAAPPDPTSPFVVGFDRFQGSSVPVEQLGELLITELSCTACHAQASSAEAASPWQPKGGPQLRGAAHRIQHAWLREFLLAPQQAKPGATMPDVLSMVPQSQREEVVDGLIAYMEQQPYPEPKIVSTASTPVAQRFWDKGEAARGAQLYHQVGCIACHAPDQEYQPENVMLSEIEQRIKKLDLDPEDLAELGLSLPKPIGSVPLPSVPAKYDSRSLTLFLVDPLLIRPSGRMPHMKLQPHEAADLAAYLISRETKASAPQPLSDDAPSPGTSKRPLSQRLKTGAAWHGKLGCARCHRPTTSPPDAATAFAPPNWEQLRPTPTGCLSDMEPSPELKANSPRYTLSKPQRDAIIAAMKSRAEAPNGSQRADTQTNPDRAVRAVVGERELTMQMLQMNCYACHQRHDLGGVGPGRWRFFENSKHVDLGDEGRMPPPLDHVGVKLQPAWLAKVFQGQGDVRPHLLARMPRFPQQAKRLADAFVATDRSKHPSLPPLKSLTNLQPNDVRDAGRRLLNTGCVQCHPLWEEHLPGVLGVDISQASNRIQPAWFQAFLRDPARWKKNTRMPTFFPKGVSTSADILEGSVEQQIAAMWSYLNSPKGQLPEKLEQGRAHNFQLTPRDEPLVLRAFMEGDLTHGIAVGFPARLHYAFDAERAALAYLWRGDFLNAHPTWFDRFTPPTKPLGELWNLPQISLAAIGPKLPAKIAASDSSDSSDSPDSPDSPDPANADAAARVARSTFIGYRLDRQRVPTMTYRQGDLNFADRIAPISAPISAPAGLDAATSPSRLRRRITVDGADKTLAQTVWFAVALDPVKVEGPRATLPGGKIVTSTNPLSVAMLGSQKVLVARLDIKQGRGTVEVAYQWQD